MKNHTSLHPEGSGKAMWEGRYHGPLLTAEKEYKASRALLESMIKFPKEFSLMHFGILEAYQDNELARVKNDFLIKAMTYASTLFSAINSPLGLLPWKRCGSVFTLREVIGEIVKCDQGLLASSHKEVLMACYMLLEKEMKGVNTNKEYFSAFAEKYLHEVLNDVGAPLSTKMLVLARASSLSSYTKEQRQKYRLKVVDYLKEIHDHPSRISNLEQEWKTYVRLARMVFAWKYMFFGLRFDGSKDLHIKSYLFFVANFYKL